MVSKLKLDDILKELKENAFTNSPMPVILSIENHLGEHQQNIMAKKLQEILGDLYIFPSEVKPEFLPTLNDMKYKFIKLSNNQAIVLDSVSLYKIVETE